MKIEEMAGRIIRHLKRSRSYKEPLPDMLEVLEEVRLKLREIIAQEDEWHFTKRHLNPFTKTYTGERYYDLPKDFLSFAGSADDDGSRPMVKLSDGSSEAFLNYVTPSQLFGSDFDAATNGKPDSFTVLTDETGHQQLVLDPPPDSNSDSHYALRVIYTRSFFDLDLDSNLPDEVCPYLEAVVEADFDVESISAQRRASQCRADFYLSEAKKLTSRLIPRMSDTPGMNEYQGTYWSSRHG